MNALPHGWCEAKLDDLGGWSSGGTPSRKVSTYYGGTIPWVKTGDLDHAILERVEEFLTAEGLRNSAAKLFPKGSLLVAMYGATIGQTAVLSMDAATNQACAALLSEGETSAIIPFVWRYLISIQDDLQAAGQGGAQPNISQSILKNYPINLAPLPEQRRIVAKIDSLTGKSKRARDHLNHIPRLVEKFKQAVLDIAFADLSSRAPLSEQVEPERGIPYGIVQTGDPFDGGVPTIRCGDIKGFRVARDGLKLVNPKIESGFRRTRLRGGEVLIAIRGSVGETCVVPSELIDCNISREVAMIPLLQGIVPDFIMYFLATTEAKRFILGNVKGVAQQGINLRDLKELQAPTGDTDTQREVVMRILRAFDWINRLASEATSARRLIDQLDQAVLAKAFRGELVPQDPDDEPASVLLDRIRAERGAAPKARRGRLPAA